MPASDLRTTLSRAEGLEMSGLNTSMPYPLSAHLCTLLPPPPCPASLPHAVECVGLTRVNLQEPGLFERELNERRDWCSENAQGAYCIQPIGPDPERLTGRRFRFADQTVAAKFKLIFPIDLWL